MEMHYKFLIITNVFQLREATSSRNRWCAVATEGIKRAKTAYENDEVTESVLFR